MEALQKILIETQQRFKIILEFIKMKNLQTTDENYTQHSIIILLALIEIEIIQEKINIESNKNLEIHQYNFNLKKPYSFPIDICKCDKEYISLFKDNIKKIKDEFETIIDAGFICESYGVSVIDDLFYINGEKDWVLNIIDKAFNSNFHKLLIDYLKQLIILKVSGKDIYTKDNLSNLYFMKYVTQMIMFMKIYIKYKLISREELSNDEVIECCNNFLNEDKTLTYFSLSLVGKSSFKKNDKPYLIKDNEKALDEVSNCYHIIMNLIKQTKQKLDTNKN